MTTKAPTVKARETNDYWSRERRKRRKWRLNIYDWIGLTIAILAFASNLLFTSLDLNRMGDALKKTSDPERIHQIVGAHDFGKYDDWELIGLAIAIPFCIAGWIKRRRNQVRTTP